ncbi:MAG: helicase-exonuclease AddAB subunit AddA, partial [Bacillota bacterium]|nr:helicase-exonuclease AddAB subunit AddA [Bacillota bacterium]
KLLVVTFTDAAAAEMRKRIGEALEKALTIDPNSDHLRRQLALINRASVSTLHSFCLEVIKKHYYLIDLNPVFRIANDAEGELLREEVLEELFEEGYSQGETSSFYELADRFCSDRNDSGLIQLVLQLYEFSRSHPWPKEWLEEMAASYQVAPFTDIDSLPWTKGLKEQLKLQLNGLIYLLQHGLKLVKKPAGPALYETNFTDDLAVINELIKATDLAWNELYRAFHAAEFPRLKSLRGIECDEALKEMVKKLRERVKEQIKKLKSSFFERKPEEYLTDLNNMAPILKSLVDLVNQFASRYQQAKRDKGILDFSDLEHYCLQILRDPQSTPTLLVPSQVALSYQEQFAEVLVDEYQDINMLQETILRLISKADTDAGNMFMVGDVKQSIYRFRLAEPELFLEKFKLYAKNGSTVTAAGLRIDLAQNFRSREQVLTGTNFIFKQIMNETVGEISYDQDAELVLGAEFPGGQNLETEVLIIDKGSDAGEEVEALAQLEAKPAAEGSEEGNNGELKLASLEEGEAELETAQLEARLMAVQIKKLIGQDGQEAAQIYDGKLKLMRPVQYRDIVILLRATRQWAPIILEEFKLQGIPAYAELATGYFKATEIAVMLSILKIIDNPYQDIPLAAALRSPIVGLDGEALGKVRAAFPRGSYYEAVKAYLVLPEHESEGALKLTLFSFVDKLNIWRTNARQGALSELIWQIYRDTGYYDLVGGMVGGQQRQANLRVLYDRARQYEQTSFRGLFRFLRFIERLQDRGSDLGTARAVGEQEDVVRVITIHKSKGLEFPIVFVAGTGKQFNMNDLRRNFLLHKKMGMGVSMIDPALRLTYPTLPQLAIRQQLALELLAEEMRLLYVAMTRAKEKLYLIGTTIDLEKKQLKWNRLISCDSWILPDFERANCRSYLDWIGSALIRHRQGAAIGGVAEGDEVGQIFGAVHQHPSGWKVKTFSAAAFIGVAVAEQEQDRKLLEAVREWQPVEIASHHQQQVFRRLSWSYPYPAATSHLGKQTVSALKYQWNQDEMPTFGSKASSRQQSALGDRPRFLQQERLTAAEIGTATHMVLQHVNLAKPVTEAAILELMHSMVDKELLTEDQKNAINPSVIAKFFAGQLGQRLLRASWVKREAPFSLVIPAKETYAGWGGAEEEQVLVQG